MRTRRLHSTSLAGRPSSERRNRRATCSVNAPAAGFTLIELMMTLAIAVILAAVAVPSLGHFIRASALRASVNDFMHSVFLARSKAVMNDTVVSICRSQDGATCAGTNTGWEHGWIVFVNTDHDQPAKRDPGEPIVQVHGPWRGGHVHSNRTTFTFRPANQGAVNGTIVFCDPREASDTARAVIISHTGRPRVSRRDASNHALSCT